MDTPRIDCDVHPHIHEHGELTKHLPRFFQQTGYGSVGHLGHGNPHGVLRRDATPANTPGAADWFDVFRILLIEQQKIDVAVLNLTEGYMAGVHPNPDYAAALCRACNEYVAEHWLSCDERYVAPILIAPQDPKQAVAEIRRLAPDRRFVGISLTPAGEALGHRRYWPIYEAAAEYALPISVHPGHETVGASRPFATGYAETYFEWHTNVSTIYMNHVISLVTRGALTTFPTLKFVLLEGGVAWLPHVLWRLDKNWKALRHTVPYLKEPPSRYVLDSIRLSTQPIEEPPSDAQLLQIFDMIEAQRTVMYSSDFPHWDNDHGDRALPRLPEPLRRRIMGETALEVYPRLRVKESAHA